MKQVIFTPNAPEPIGPYSQAILIQNTLYISGQIAINPKTNQLVNMSIVEETKQVLDNLKQVLLAASMDFDHVVKTSIFLKSMDDFAVVNQIYGEYFTNNFPARETVAVRTLPKDVNVEISAIAIKY
jgi:2-iminobutanoate/2-iminopropanoate deaminase